MTESTARPGACRFLDETLARTLAPYTPGEQPKDVADLLKLNTNENPYPPSLQVVSALAAQDPADARLYPDPEATSFKQALSETFGRPASWFSVGNGSDELPMVMRPYEDGVIWEFDSLADLQEFDSDFIDNVDVRSCAAEHAAHMVHDGRIHVVYEDGVIWEFDSLADLQEFDSDFIDNVDSAIMDHVCRMLGCAICISLLFNFLFLLHCTLCLRCGFICM